MNKTDTKLINLVIVEDNMADFRLMELAFAEKHISNNLNIIHLKDGEEVLDFINSIEENHSKTEMILLDLHIPKLNGFEVLEKIKEKSEFESVPIFVFSNSSNQEDIQRSFELKANGYMQKPINIDELFEITDVLVEILERKATNFLSKSKLLKNGQLVLANQMYTA